MSERKATAAPIPMPTLAPVLSGVALAEGTTGTGVPLAIGVAVGEEVMAVVRLPELVAEEEDADRVVETSVVVEEEGVCSVSVTVPEPDASGRGAYVALDLKSE